jgi:hypothetical protein
MIWKEENKLKNKRRSNVGNVQEPRYKNTFSLKCTLWEMLTLPFMEKKITLFISEVASIVRRVGSGMR